MPSKQTEWNYKKANQLAQSLTNINDKLDKIVSQIATTTESSNIYWSGVQRDIRKLYEDLRLKVKTWTENTMPIGYNNTIRMAIFKIKNTKIVPNQKVTYRQFVNKDSTKQSLKALLNETLSTFGTGFLSGQNTMIQLARLTQQVNFNEKQINEQVSKGFIESGSVQGSTKLLRNKLLKKAIDGKYITVVNKNGDPMQFNVKYYSELVARTKLMQASSQGVINTAFGVGGDLVQWTAYNTTCPVCAPHEGVIYSLSGNDKDFPAIGGDVPPLHPHCRHSLTIVFKEALEADGTLDKYIDFSNGETGIHPTRKSFIPVNKRKLTA